VSIRLGLHPSEAERVASVLCFFLAVSLLFARTFGASVGPALLPVVGLCGAGLALAWLIRLVLVLVRWRRHKRAVVEHKGAWLLLPCIVALMGGALSLSDWIESRSLAFEGERWRKVSASSGDLSRWRMRADVLANHVKPGMTREGVLALLGTPDAPAWDAPRLLWWLRDDDGLEKGRWYIEVQFDTGHVRSASVRLE